MIGSTAISRSLLRSHSTTLGLGKALVGSLRILASTKYLTRCPLTRIQWGRKILFRDKREATRLLPHSAELKDAGACIPLCPAFQFRIPVPIQCCLAAAVARAIRSGL